MQPQFLTTALPKFPETPPTGGDVASIIRWIKDFQTELEKFFDIFRQLGTDQYLVANVDFQNLTAGFSVLPSAFFLGLSSTQAVISDASGAIKSPGRPGQWIVLQNTGTFNITIKNNAITKLSGGVDLVLTPRSVVVLRWDGTNWTQVSPASFN